MIAALLQRMRATVQDTSAQRAPTRIYVVDPVAGADELVRRAAVAGIRVPELSDVMLHVRAGGLGSLLGMPAVRLRVAAQQMYHTTGRLVAATDPARPVLLRMAEILELAIESRRTPGIGFTRPHHDDFAATTPAELV